MRGISLSVENDTPKLEEDRLSLFERTKSRMVITSGNIEPVLDGGGGKHSVFARALIEVLLETRSPLTSTELYTRVSQIVVKESQSLGSTQVPTMAALTQAGHLGPDYVFHLK